VIPRAEVAFLEKLLPRQRHHRFWLMDAAAEGSVYAYRRLGLLSRRESARWRQRFGDPEAGIAPGSVLGAEARVAAEEDLGGLVERLTPLRRELDAASVRRNAECEWAISTLYRIGVLDERARSRWLAESWRKLAPWHPEPVQVEPWQLALPADDLIWIPPDNEQQAAEDAAAAAIDAAEEAIHAAEWEMVKQIRRVLTGSPERQDGLALTALVAHNHATSLHFHYLGSAQSQPSTSIGTFSGEVPEGALDPLTPPSLWDDAGQTYQPVGERPDLRDSP
jgi:hypothetical protein